MTTSTRAETRATTQRTHVRLAGWGALAAAASYSLQPILVMTIWAPPPGESLADSYPSPADIEPLSGEGIYSILAFSVTGLGILLLASGIHRASEQRLGDGGPWAAVTALLGATAGIAWILAAAVARTTYSTVATALAEVGADTGSQKAALQAVNIVLSGVLIFSSICFTGWLLGMTHRARRAKLFGTALSLFAYAVAGLGVASTVVVGSFIGLVAIIPLLFVLGFVLLRKSATLGNSAEA